MSAYATGERRQSGHVLSVEPDLLSADFGIATAVTTTGSDHTRVDSGSTLDALLDRLADRVAAAVITRLGGERNDRDEWFDSRQAAQYLGLHRDTLRRLAAARAIPAEQDGHGCRLFFRRTVLDEWRRSGGRSRHLTAIADAA
jgi:excisionase family DNA binding protein